MSALDLAGVVLAAGRGSRMRPLTDRVPKPLLTVGNVSLLRLALDRVGALTPALAVNTHHLADQIAAAAVELRPEVHVSHEVDLLGTAGALHRLRGWIDGRPVVVANSDTYLAGAVDALVADWDGRRPRLLVREVGAPADFGTRRFLGVSTVPARVAATLEAEPSGLFTAVWRGAFAAGEVEFVEFTGAAFDCGTAAEFLAANMFASGGASVVAPDARVLGTVDRSVVLAGGVVGPEEHLVNAIRDRFGQTLLA